MKRMQMQRQTACADCATTPVASCPTMQTIEFQVGPPMNPATASFVVTLDGPTNMGLTWTYKVRNTGERDLSHFNIQICGEIETDEIMWEILELNDDDTCGELLESGTGPNTFFEVPGAGNGNDEDCIVPANVPYIKFTELDQFDAENFCFRFTLPECLQVGCICVNANAASGSDCACIQGPSSTCEPCPAVRGIKL